MIAITNEFRNALKTNGKLIDTIISDGTNEYIKQNIISIDYSYKADLFKSFMRQCDVELLGDYNLKDSQLNIQFGVKQSVNDGYEYIEFGNFIVKEQEYILNTKSTKLECYDLMLQSMIPYDLELTYPITVGDYLQAICDRLGWNLADTTFINSNKEILEEKYDNTYTFRDVLDEIARTSLSLIGFKYDNQLHVIYPTETNEIIDFNLRKFSVNDKYGVVNSLVLARTPQEDNIFRQDEDSIAENGLTEIKIENNQIMDKDRDAFIDDMFNYINGFEYYPFQFESFGICYLEIGDRFTIVDPLTGISYSTILLSDNIQITQGLNEIAASNIPSATTTDYSKASKTNRAINQTKLQVDKQNQTIEGLVSTVEANTTNISNLLITSSGFQQQVSEIYSNINDLNNDIINNLNILQQQIVNNTTLIEQKSTEVNTTISATGGNNKVRNSVGYKGTEFWELSEGATVNTVQDNDTESATISGSKFVLSSGIMSSYFNNIIDSNYVISFKYKHSGGSTPNEVNVNFYINDENYFSLLSTTDYNDDWEEVVLPYRALTNNPYVVFDCGGDTLQFSDFLVNDGTEKQPWTQYFDELYGKTHTLDKTGLIIKEIANNNQSHFDTNSLEFIQNGNIVSKFDTSGINTNNAVFNVSKKVGNLTEIAIDDYNVIEY